MENTQLISEVFFGWAFLVFGAILIFGVGYSFKESLRYLFPENSRSNQLQFIRDYEFSEGFKSKFSKTKPFLQPEAQKMVFSALKEYFYICNKAGQKMVSMPSQIVDDAWHEFILFTREYQEFCDRAFGYFLHHTPAEAMNGSTSSPEGIRLAWRLACIREKIQPQKPDRLPLLFAIDSLLEIKEGFYYELDCSNNSDRPRNQNNYYCVTNIGCATGCSGSISSDCNPSDSGGSGCGSSCGGGCGGGCGGC